MEALYLLQSVFDPYPSLGPLLTLLAGSASKFASKIIEVVTFGGIKCGGIQYSSLDLETCP